MVPTICILYTVSLLKVFKLGAGIRQFGNAGTLTTTSFQALNVIEILYTVWYEVNPSFIYCMHCTLLMKFLSVYTVTTDP